MLRSEAHGSCAHGAKITHDTISVHTPSKVLFSLHADIDDNAARQDSVNDAFKAGKDKKSSSDDILSTNELDYLQREQVGEVVLQNLLVRRLNETLELTGRTRMMTTLMVDKTGGESELSWQTRRPHLRTEKIQIIEDACQICIRSKDSYKEQYVPSFKMPANS